MTEAPLWTPSPEHIAHANLTRFMDQVRATPSRPEISDFQSLYDWSIRDLESFWSEVWRFGGVVASAGGPDA